MVPLSRLHPLTKNEYAVMHGDEAEAERIREDLRKLTDEVLRQRGGCYGIMLAEKVE